LAPYPLSLSLANACPAGGFVESWIVDILYRHGITLGGSVKYTKYLASPVQNIHIRRGRAVANK